ncbi:MAG: Na+/H+ antiporter NhaC family protein [Floccifex porci]|uniref:Na+/H+ antiporter NhaC family protein n=1 Tax=Floccifex porci TaxID=2606629 RepID=UPI0023F1DFC1|nr:Na+/H+ antiporter NhaC family protein [Floccifex porci]MDD7467730.1 Na+/H+ antiporter NhaC family protein [Floccifex porci]MDO4480323.1 Na+/H+ antiporter NhaC family protein [Erysipelotrichaceae bacterium]
MNFIGTGWALLPAVVAIVLALKTKEVYISLFIGIFIGALLFNDFHLFKAILSVFEVMMERLSSTWNIGILIFLVFLGIIVALMTRAGGSQAYGNWATRTIKNQKMALLSSFGLGVLIFVDDYFNCLTVGSVMRDICDRFKISRAKLAYIIDATAAPICIIAPISSWAAAVTGYTTGDGFTLFLQTIPFNLYALLTIVMVLCVIFFDINIGKMKEHEQAARQGDVFNGKCDYGKAQEMEVSDKGKVYDLVLPVIFLIVSCILCMVYTGGFFDGVPFVTAFSQCDASLGLVIGSFLTLIFMFLLYMPRKVITYNDFAQCIPQGFKMMVPAMTILTLAWTLGSFVSVQLEAGVFVQEMLNTYNIPLFILPPVLFLVATGLAFSTGTSWGTFAILIPIVTDIFASGSSMLVISIASILAGAVCGDHVSPISDTTIMASAGAQCNHVYHVSTQLPYAMVVAISCFAGYIVAGITHNVFFTFIAGLCTLFLILFCIVKKNKQNNN